MNIKYDNFLSKSYEIALNSPDPSTQNGAVLLRAYEPNPQVIGEGCNDFPKGINSEYWYGEKEDKYARVVHAEVSAILDAARQGHSTMGSTLVCPWAACSNCSKHIAAAGIVRLVRHSYSNNGASTGSHWYDDCRIGDEIMREAGIEIVETEPLYDTGIQLRRNGSMWPEVQVGASQ